MNIFYISSSSFPSRRANAVHVTSMCRALNNLGHYVYLFVKSEGNNIKNFIINNYEIKSSLTQIIETKTFFRRGTEFFIAITALIKYLSLKRSQKNSSLKYTNFGKSVLTKKKHGQTICLKMVL